MRRNCVQTTVLALGMTVAGCGGETPTTLDSIIASHTAARGGEEAIESVYGVRHELEIEEAQFTASAVYIATRDGYMRIDVHIGGERVFSEALGPEGGWQLGQGETAARPLSPEGEAALRQGQIVNLRGLHELGSLGFTLTLVETEDPDAGPFWLIDRESPDGTVDRLFLDKSTFLVDREQEESALHPDIDPTVNRFETVFSDYTASEGVLFARQSAKMYLESGEVVQRTTTLSTEINPVLEPESFLPPQEESDQDPRVPER